MKENSRAVTLVELIISSLIVSMVVAGVFSAEYALRRMNETGAKDATLNIQAQSVAESVRATVRTLHGDISAASNGFYFNQPTKTFCFRHDVLSAGQYTPENYADDDWTCYTQIGVKVYSCERSPASACPNTAFLVGELVSDQFTNAVILALGPGITTNSATGEYYFQMTFVGRLDPSAGAAVAAGSLTAGTEDNPQTVIKIRENAPGF